MSRKHIQSQPNPLGHRALRRRKKQKRNLAPLWIGAAALVIILVGTVILLPKGSSAVEISPAEAYARFQKGAWILDVRTQDEWDQFHIQGSTLIPLTELQARVNELPRDREILVVCRSGRRSLSAASILQKAGYTRLASLSGGLNAWTAVNYPIEGDAP